MVSFIGGGPGEYNRPVANDSFLELPPSGMLIVKRLISLMLAMLLLGRLNCHE